MVSMCKYSSVLYRIWDVWRWIISWNLGSGSLTIRVPAHGWVWHLQTHNYLVAADMGLSDMIWVCLYSLLQSISCHWNLEEGKFWRKNYLCDTVVCTIVMVQKATSSSYRSVDCISNKIVTTATSEHFRDEIFLLTSFFLPFSELSLVGLALDVVD